MISLRGENAAILQPFPVVYHRILWNKIQHSTLSPTLATTLVRTYRVTFRTQSKLMKDALKGVPRSRVRCSLQRTAAAATRQPKHVGGHLTSYSVKRSTMSCTSKLLEISERNQTKTGCSQRSNKSKSKPKRWKMNSKHKKQTCPRRIYG